MSGFQQAKGAIGFGRRSLGRIVFAPAAFSRVRPPHIVARDSEQKRTVASTHHGHPVEYLGPEIRKRGGLVDPVDQVVLHRASPIIEVRNDNRQLADRKALRFTRMGDATETLTCLRISYQLYRWRSSHHNHAMARHLPESMPMPRIASVLLACLVATEAHGHSDRYAVFHAAYCIGAISEGLSRAGVCERRLGKEPNGLTTCRELKALDNEVLLTRLQRHLRVVDQQAKGKTAIATELRSLMEFGQAHLRSGRLAEMAYYEHCLRDCLSWPPTEGCAERAR